MLGGGTGPSHGTLATTCTPGPWHMGRMIQCQTPAMGPMVGVAVTCEMDSSTPGGEPDFEAFYGLLEQIQKVGLPAVWVVKTEADSLESAPAKLEAARRRW